MHPATKNESSSHFLISWLAGLLIVLVCCNGADLMPVDTQTTTTPTTTNTPNEDVTSTTSTSNPIHESDFVQDEQAFAAILQRSAVEAEELARRSRDFVSDDLSVDEIMNMFSESSSGSSSSDSETSQSQDSILSDNVEQPAGSDTEQTASETTTTEPTTTEQTTTEPTTTTLDPRLYVYSEDDLNQLLSSIKTEFLEAKTHPANFIKDDAEFEYILSRLRDGENVIDSRLKRWEDGLPLVYEVDICPICHDDMESGGDDSRKTACNHEFHTECIGSYLGARNVQNFKCPVCRRMTSFNNVNWR